MRLQDNVHYLLLVWLVITGLIVFGVVVAWNEGLVSQLIAGDRSRISLVIALLYVIGSIHCAIRVIYLSTELNLAASLGSGLAGGRENNSIVCRNGDLTISGTLLPKCVLTDHLVDLYAAQSEQTSADLTSDQSNLTEALAERLKGSHDLGWFTVDILLKLGLVGTIIGFILMLGSVANTATFDVNTMQKVLWQMSSGMGTALFTTLAGLVGSILLGLQYLLLDKSADELIHRVIRVAEIEFRPIISTS